MEENNIPIVSIGLPIHNAEKIIRKKIDSILCQTFENFELIISDNASTDNTSKLCKEYLENEKRIKFFQQKENLGLTKNFEFVLNNSHGEFFMWTAVDDIISPNFIEKNLCALNEKKIIGSVSKIKHSDEKEHLLELDKTDKIYRELMEKWYKVKKLGTRKITGNYDEKTNFYLKNSDCAVIFGLFRKEQMKNSYVTQIFEGNDWATMLNILKFGELNVVEDDELIISLGGSGSRGAINVAKQHYTGPISLIFPFAAFTAWSLKNLGTKTFFKNLDFFIRINVEVEFSLIFDALRIIVKKLKK